MPSELPVRLPAAWVPTMFSANVPRQGLFRRTPYRTRTPARLKACPLIAGIPFHPELRNPLVTRIRTGIAQGSHEPLRGLACRSPKPLGDHLSEQLRKGMLIPGPHNAHTRPRCQLDDLSRQRRNASNARALPSGVFGPVESPP